MSRDVYTGCDTLFKGSDCFLAFEYDEFDRSHFSVHCQHTSLSDSVTRRARFTR